MPSYQPKGQMCANCKHKHRDCSHLEFDKMPVIEYSALQGIKVVACRQYDRAVK